VEDETEMESRDEYEKGDRIFTCHIFPPNQEIHATGTFFQHLAEAHLQNMAPRLFRDSIPDYLHEYKDVFAKESFDTFPEWCQWDHAIELVPDSKLSNCKVYPMSMTKQAKLDHFIMEHQQTGHIHLSISVLYTPSYVLVDSVQTAQTLHRLC
jgi:hypothetical protein